MNSEGSDKSQNSRSSANYSSHFAFNEIFFLECRKCISLFKLEGRELD